MKIVDIIRPGSINAIVGPVGTLKRILSDKTYFHQRGYDVTVFTNDSYAINGLKNVPSFEQTQNDFNREGIIYRLKMRLSQFIQKQARVHNAFAIFWINREKRKVKKLVESYIAYNRTPDIVQFHSNFEAFFYLKYRKEHNAKTVMFLHTDGEPYKMMLQYYPKMEGSAYFKQYQKEFEWTVKNVDRICFIAKVGQRTLLSHFPFRTVEDTSVIINGINDFTADERKVFDKGRALESSNFKFRMCCTGSINSRKGHRIIIEALLSLPEQYRRQFHVDFIGEGPEKPILEQIVKDYMMEENFTFVGQIPNNMVYQYLSKNNIYILMSKNEGLPISIIEAMRAEMMIISTNVSGIPELVNDGYNGFLILPDQNELSKVLLTLDNCDIQTMGKKSREKYEKEFTFKRMECDFCNMYDKELA